MRRALARVGGLPGALLLTALLIGAGSTAALAAQLGVL